MVEPRRELGKKNCLKHFVLIPSVHHFTQNTTETHLRNIFIYVDRECTKDYTIIFFFFLPSWACIFRSCLCETDIKREPCLSKSRETLVPMHTLVPWTNSGSGLYLVSSWYPSFHSHNLIFYQLGFSNSCKFYSCIMGNEQKKSFIYVCGLYLFFSRFVLHLWTVHILMAQRAYQ